MRFFDRNGNFLKRSGGKGDGPGEFASIGSIFRYRGDTLLVHDNRNSLVVFDSAGKFTRSGKVMINEWEVAELIGILDDGTLISRWKAGAYEGAPDQALAGRRMLRYVALSTSGAVVAELGLRPAPQVGSHFPKNTPMAAIMGGVGERPVMDNTTHCCRAHSLPQGTMRSTSATHPRMKSKCTMRADN